MTAIQIRDVYHEFTSIPGVKEDVTQIVLNVKKLRLKSFATHPVQLKLIKSGAGIVTAADIQESADVEIVNPELPIMTLDSDDVTIEMDLTVEKGVGYLAAERAESIPDRRHPHRRDLHACPQGQLLDREHSRRADDQLRQADDRARDGRHDLAGGGAQSRRRHPGPPVLALRQHRPRRGRHRIASTDQRSRSSRRTCSTCRSRSSTCRCGPTTRSSATTSSRSASCFSSPTTICCECATSARSRWTR